LRKRGRTNVERFGGALAAAVGRAQLHLQCLAFGVVDDVGERAPATRDFFGICGKYRRRSRMPPVHSATDCSTMFSTSRTLPG